MQQRRTESDETRTGRRGAPLDRGGRLSIASGGDQQILLGGLTIGLLAYELSLGDAEPPVVDGLTGRQRVFHNWALVWRIKTRPELALQMLSVDPHSPAEFRANIVRNLDEFHAAFATTPSDDLWLDPESRVRIW